MLLPTRTVLAALPAAVAARPLQRLRVVEYPGADPGAKPGSLPAAELLLRAWTPEAAGKAAGSGLGSGSGHAPVYLLENAGGFLRAAGARAGDRLALAVVGGQLRIEVRVPWVFISKCVRRRLQRPRFGMHAVNMCGVRSAGELFN